MSTNSCTIATDCDNIYNRKCCTDFCTARLVCDGVCRLTTSDCNAKETCCAGKCYSTSYICCENNNQCHNGMKCDKLTYSCELDKSEGRGLAVGFGVLGGFVLLGFVVLRFYITCKQANQLRHRNIPLAQINRANIRSNNDHGIPLPPPYSSSMEPANLDEIPRVEEGTSGSLQLHIQGNEPVVFSQDNDDILPPPPYAPRGSVPNEVETSSSQDVLSLETGGPNTTSFHDPMLPPPVYTPQGSPLEDGFHEDSGQCEPPPPYESQDL